LIRQEKIVDLSYVKGMASGNMELIKEMIDIFISQVPEFLEDMKTVHDKKDWYNLGLVAHKAKSSVAVMGMERQAAALKNLEMLAKKEKDVDKYIDIINVFEEDCKKAIQELEIIKNT
jgi:HPt (histidine-containing phosphotransfer) domain-containing protein